MNGEIEKLRSALKNYQQFKRNENEREQIERAKREQELEKRNLQARLTLIVILVIVAISYLVYVSITDAINKKLARENAMTLFFNGKYDKAQASFDNLSTSESAPNPIFIEMSKLIEYNKTSPDYSKIAILDKQLKDIPAHFLEGIAIAERLQENPNARIFLGDLYLNGLGVVKDMNVALRYFATPAENGNHYAMMSTAKILLMPDLKSNVHDREHALQTIQNLSNKGNAEAQYYLGYSYLESKDYKNAAYWFRKSSEGKYPWAEQRLKDVYYSDTSNLSRKDREKIEYLFGKILEQDEVEDDLHLGNLYCELKYYERALYWLKMAANKRHSEAIFKIGKIYCDGLKDYKQAFYWFDIASKQGNGEAKYQLGEMYYYGNGIDKNYEKAFEIFSELAEQNKHNAQYFLGNMYERGHGVIINPVKAKYWYMEASKNGSIPGKLACKGIDTVIQKAKQLFERPDYYQVVEFNGHHYCSTIQVGGGFHLPTFDEAEKRCEELGGHLCTITSEEEFNAVRKIAKGLDVYTLGANDFESKGVWKWITGEPFTFEKWNTTYPEKNGYDERILLMRFDPYYGQYDNGHWGWKGGSRAAAFAICEWEF